MPASSRSSDRHRVPTTQPLTLPSWIAVPTSGKRQGGGKKERKKITFQVKIDSGELTVSRPDGRRVLPADGNRLRRRISGSFSGVTGPAVGRVFLVFGFFLFLFFV